ncbi:hypothetical protein IG631_00171 [Alternaria alternata]|nr:hypothetical protein IG631_00171 [Alternaria alternata]
MLRRSVILFLEEWPTPSSCYHEHHRGLSIAGTSNLSSLSKLARTILFNSTASQTGYYIMYFTQVSLVVLAGATIATAAPLEAPKHTLYGRTAQYHSSCDKPGPDGGENMKVKAQRAFTDASQMAYQTQIRHDNSGNAFTESSAYRHYFADADKDQVKRMMQVIYNNRLPVDDNDGGQGYFIDIRCGNSEDPQTCSGSTLAGTNARPGQSVVSQPFLGVSNAIQMLTSHSRWFSAIVFSATPSHAPRTTSKPRNSTTVATAGASPTKNSPSSKSRV